MKCVLTIFRCPGESSLARTTIHGASNQRCGRCTCRDAGTWVPTRRRFRCCWCRRRHAHWDLIQNIRQRVHHVWWELTLLSATKHRLLITSCCGYKIAIDTCWIIHSTFSTKISFAVKLISTRIFPLFSQLSVISTASTSFRLFTATSIHSNLRFSLRLLVN